MKTKIGLCFAGLVLSAAASFAADPVPFAGKWATNAYGEINEEKKPGFLAKLGASALSNGQSGGKIGSEQPQNAPRVDQGTFKGGQMKEPALAMIVKIDEKGGKTTITLDEVIPKPYSKKTLKPEEVTLTAQKFEFVTTEKNEKISTTIRWVGELSGPDTLKMTRETKSGSPIDDGPIVFHRAQ